MPSPSASWDPQQLLAPAIAEQLLVHDGSAERPTPNMQITENEKLHIHHIHITVNDVKNIFLNTLIIISISVLSLTTTDANSKEIRYPTLKIQGEDRPNACSPESKKNLQQSVLNSKEEYKKRPEAWRLIDVLLCGDYSSENRRYLTESTAPKLRSTSESTGDNGEAIWIKRDQNLIDSLISNGQAWDAYIQTSRNEIQLTYASDEACIKTRTFQFAKGTWRLIAIGEACD